MNRARLWAMVVASLMVAATLFGGREAEAAVARKPITATDIKGIYVGNAENATGGTGCTVVICPRGATPGVDVRGGGPASRETELPKPTYMVPSINAVMLSGGSAFGLAAGDGAMQFLEERGFGFETGFGVVPIVCGASIFDLCVGDRTCRPDKAMGYAACEAAMRGEFREGCHGAGMGATVGKFFGADRMMKSGLGMYGVQIGDVQCVAVVVVNALGDVIDYDSRARLAGLLNADRTALARTDEAMFDQIDKTRNFKGEVTNTTIAVLLTNAKLTKAEANKLASVAHNGYALAINPVHTSGDGDTIFVMATGEVACSADNLGCLATEVMARAINRAVTTATPMFGLKCAADLQ